MSRFNFNANTLPDAKEYILCRAKQLLRHSYKLNFIQEYEWGISALFEKDKQLYQSLYILQQYRGNGVYLKNVKQTILTSQECGIEEYLLKNNIAHVTENLTPFREYKIVQDFYGNKKTQRSNIHLMNHIDEGLWILTKINASEIAKKAYCLHPIIQSDEDLLQNYHLLNDIDVQTIIALTEYRSVANEYLSKRIIKSIDEIRLSPLKDVNDMLIADKIQNKKDFDLYHKNTHLRSQELTHYFDNWLKKLNITENFYTDCFQFLHND